MDSSLPAPEPSAGLAAYEAERAACLALSPEKAANYARFLEANYAWSSEAKRGAEVDYWPVKLDIENVSRCNFACTMCAVSTWPKRRRARDMSLASFCSLIDEQIGLVEIKLNGLGEALMQGEDYFEMIRYARSRRIWVRMTTNASLLHLKRNHLKLLDADVNEIDISIDGANERVFEAIRVGGNFRVVTRNCEMLNAEARARGITRTKMWTLVQKANWRDLYDHVKLAADLGFRHLVFSVAMHGWGDEALGARNAANAAAPGYDYLYGLIEWGNQLGVIVRFWTVAAKFTRENPCPWPFERAVVTSDLRTVPCCMIGNPDAFEIGRGTGARFGELWWGEEYRAFRQQHLDGEIPQVCRGCYA